MALQTFGEGKTKTYHMLNILGILKVSHLLIKIDDIGIYSRQKENNIQSLRVDFLSIEVVQMSFGKTERRNFFDCGSKHN